MPSRRVAPVLAVVLLLVVGVVTLERAAVLPDPAARVVRHLEVWLGPVLREAGIELPQERDAADRPIPPSMEEDRQAARRALALLEDISVRAERRRDYEREDWPHWLDLDGDCMDARQEVLAAESVEPARLDAGACRVERGLWRDVYTGESFRDPGDLDVDHFVPLAEAHRSGGHDWSRERRAAFANDLADARTLVAVSASANRAKGDQGPEDWLPPERAYQCRNVADWAVVKARWSLAMDERERVTVGNLLQACAGN